MKKLIIALSVIIILFFSGVALAREVRVAGDWSDWWSLGGKYEQGSYGKSTLIRRIYDQENKLVCWVVVDNTGRGGVAIDCQPSLELGNPLVK